MQDICTLQAGHGGLRTRGAGQGTDMTDSAKATPYKEGARRASTRVVMDSEAQRNGVIATEFPPLVKPQLEVPPPPTSSPHPPPDGAGLL